MVELHVNHASFRPADHMAAASTSAADEQSSAQGNETSLDINLLKEIAKKALVDALNSVRCHVVPSVQQGFNK